MLGKSIYISDFNEKMKIDEKVDLYFTSFHIEEEFNDEYRLKAKKLLSCLKEMNKKIIVDISPRGIHALGYKSLVDFVLDTKIDGLRFDFGFNEEEMMEVSKLCMIALNASTCELETVKKFKDINCIAIHNYYPRMESGLDVDYFNEQNELFHQLNIPVYAFISGDTQLRGPLFERLVTIEKHRSMSCYAQYLDMKSLGIHNIIIADQGISDEQFDFIMSTEKDGVIRLKTTLDEDYQELYNHVFTNRKDSPNGLIRVLESRQYATQGKLIKPNHCIERNKGSITIDNENFLRYSGEIQIMKQDYPQSERINVIGQVKDVHVLKYIDRNKKLMFIKE